MADRQGVEGVPISPAVQPSPGFGRAIGAAWRTFRDVWLGPGLPMADAVPPGAERKFEYQTGYNITRTTSRGQGLSSFQQLRSLARMQNLLRMAIETRKDQMAKLPWSFRPKRRKGEKLADAAKRMDDPRILELENFFQRPGNAVYYPEDKGKPQIVSMKWDGWSRALIEDVLVIDAPAVAIRRNLAGTPFSLDVVDGATVKPLIDSYGSIVASQQYVYGMPDRVLGPSEMVYMPRNPSSDRIYGFSPVEQILLTVNIALRRSTMQLAFYTTGNIPEGFMRMPDSWTPDQIEKFQRNYDAYLSGNDEARSKMIAIPGGGDPVFSKRDSLKTEEDEWWARLIFYAFSLSPQALMKQMNRATAQTADETAKEEGLQPLMIYVESYVNELLRQGWGPEYADEIEFAFEFAQDIDPVDQATVDKEYISCGVLSINEVRERKGMDPIEGGETHGFLTAMGFTPLEQALMPPEPAPDTTGDPNATPEQKKKQQVDQQEKLAGAFEVMRRAHTQVRKRKQYGRGGVAVPDPRVDAPDQS